MENSGIFTHIYHNFFSVCALIPAAFMLTLGIILLMVPRKSKATLHLAVTYVMLMIFFSGYIIAAMVYHPAAAYHRWITTGFVIMSEIHFIVAFLYLSDDKKPHIARIVGSVLYAILIPSWIAFMAVTYHSPKIYNFDGHYWDFDSDLISTYIALLIILHLALLLVIGLWRIVTTKDRSRWMLLSIVMLVCLIIFFPAIANLLSRNGILDRGTYQITLDLFTIIAFFSVFIIFFNTTRERTSLLVKILGISFATLLIVVQGVSYFALKGLDESYDALRRSDTIIAAGTGHAPPELSYLIEYSIVDGRAVLLKGKPSIDMTSLRVELSNSSLIERLRLLGRQPVGSFRAEMERLMTGCPVHFDGYRSSILALLDRMPDDTADPSAETLAHIGVLQNKISAMAGKISRLPDRNFAEQLDRHLSVIHPGMEHFTGALRAFAQKSRLDGPRLKQDILLFLSPMLPAEQRLYRTGTDGRTHYIAYMRYDAERKVMNEAGFRYLDYRAYHHRTARKFIIMFAVILAVTLLGFRFFFLGAYVRPIRRLLGAITRVREGNYDITLPVTVNDELGYITQNFNEMTSTLQMSREALSDYAENLQQMVDDRTRELEQARDAIWGEMELARKMQTILIPDNPRMEGYEIAGHMAPAEMVGGDYYDIINAAGMDWVVIGDVSGHGVPAGIIMMMVQTSIHTVLTGNPLIRPSDLLERVNAVITDNIQKLREDKYMTITVIACLSDGSLRASGLHQDILVYRSGSNRVETVKTCGILLGLKDIIEYVPGDRELTLERDDVLMLYTDGITESWKKGTRRNQRNPRTDMFGQERLAAILCRHSAAGPGEIRDAVLEELKGYHCTDDVTMVIIKKR